MSKLNLIVALLVPAAGGTALASGDGRLPGTMNFDNVTSSRINALAEPESTNEKEVEYGDFDEDGDLDVVVANAQGDFGDRRNKLYQNNGGVFDEITLDGAIPGFSVPKVSRKAFFRDFSGDGHLDIWIINDANSHNDQLFIAQWAGGDFQSYLEDNSRIPGNALTGAACSGWSADFDQDLDMDVYCGNYPNSAQDRLYSNNGTGFFTDITGTHVPAGLDYVVDVCGADMNGDGKLDLLISNHGANDPNWIYYNHNLNAGSGIGDFRYTGSQQNLGNPASDENSMVAADFDNDNDMDFYWGNAFFNFDSINRNNGNDADNKATFTELFILPESVTSVISRKTTVADFNNDGRIDALVMKGAASDSRPTVLRNITVNGNIEFVDWTPAPAFPTGSAQRGWHSAAFDTNNDQDTDIFLGGWGGDDLFENVPGEEYSESVLGSPVIPGVFDGDPAAVVGKAPGPDVYTVNGMTPAAFMSVVLNGADDYLLELVNGKNVVATFDRGGAGVEEAGSYDPDSMPSSLDIRVTILACGDDPYHYLGTCGAGIEEFLGVLGAWGPNPGHPADFDGDDVVGINDLLDLLANWGEHEYILEVLARD